MVLLIKKFGSGYIAIATPPNSKVELAVLEPLAENDLRRALLEIECHPIDMWDALADTDPEIHKSLEEAGHRLLVESAGRERAAEIEKKTQEEFR